MENTDLTKLIIDPSWKKALQKELEAPYFHALMEEISRERSLNFSVYPPENLVFNAFAKTPFDKVKVVIVGQDPYHGPGQAQGLSFSVPHGIPLPPSLKNIFKELKTDLGIEAASQGSLEKWAEQGVLLLNATLTVRQGSPMSHHGKGWEQFTDAVLQALYNRPDPVVFVLWGKSAQDKCRFLLEKGSAKHLILMAAHPSPFSVHRGFFGCRHFSKINHYLQEIGKKPIDWKLA